MPDYNIIAMAFYFYDPFWPDTTLSFGLLKEFHTNSERKKVPTSSPSFLSLARIASFNG
jgi:hypothetical protein